MSQDANYKHAEEKKSRASRSREVMSKVWMRKVDPQFSCGKNTIYEHTLYTYNKYNGRFFKRLGKNNIL